MVLFFLLGCVVVRGQDKSYSFFSGDWACGVSLHEDKLATLSLIIGKDEMMSVVKIGKIQHGLKCMHPDPRDIL